MPTANERMNELEALRQAMAARELLDNTSGELPNMEEAKSYARAMEEDARVGRIRSMREQHPGGPSRADAHPVWAARDVLAEMLRAEGFENVGGGPFCVNPSGITLTADALLIELPTTAGYQMRLQLGVIHSSDVSYRAVLNAGNGNDAAELQAEARKQTKAMMLALFNATQEWLVANE